MAQGQVFYVQIFALAHSLQTKDSVLSSSLSNGSGRTTFRIEAVLYHMQLEHSAKIHLQPLTGAWNATDSYLPFTIT